MEGLAASDHGPPDAQSGFRNAIVHCPLECAYSLPDGLEFLHHRWYVSNTRGLSLPILVGSNDQNKMKLKRENLAFPYSHRDHKAHHFVVDSSNEFSVCGICGLKRPRKIIGWDTKE